ncbi:MAG: outer membrane beta-barrel protein [Prevotella sp.]|nr:outer membrane beta-barrel protein [Prevotella sp.]
MKSNDWTSQLSQRLADHQEPAPEGLWGRIETQLDADIPQQPAIVPASHRSTLRRWMAAASVALLIGGGAYLFMHNDQAPTVTAPITTKLKPSSTPSTIATPSSTTEQSSTSPKAIIASPSSRLLAQRSPQEIEANLAVTTMQAEAEITSTATDISAEKETTSAKEDEIKDTKELKENASATTAERTVTPHSLSEATGVSNTRKKELETGYPTKIITAGSNSHNHGLGISLYAQNNLVAEQQNTPVLMSNAYYQQFSNSEIAYTNSHRRGAPQSNVYLSNYKEQTHHHLPLTIGLSVSYPLGDRLALSSGLVYTRAASDFQRIMPASAINTHQTLHYIGIPLQLHYTFLRLQSLSLYANAGGQTDINVKAQQTTEGVPVEANRDNLQWSLTGAVGLQYPIIPHLALYGEAGARWYIDNNSNVDTYFKQHPLSPHLQVGFRFTLGEE